MHFVPSHPVDLIFIQESKLNSSSFLGISGFSVVRSDSAHYRSGILSPNDPHASGGVIIFFRQGLFFSEPSTSFLSLLDLFSEYVGVNISLNNSSSLSFLNVCAPPIRSSSTDNRTDSFFLSIFSSCRNLFILGTSTAISPSEIQKVLLTPAGRKYSIRSSLLTFFLSMTQTGQLFSIVYYLTFPLLHPLLLLEGASELGV